MKEAKSEAEQIVSAYRAEMEAKYQEKLSKVSQSISAVGRRANASIFSLPCHEPKATSRMVDILRTETGDCTRGRGARLSLTLAVMCILTGVALCILPLFIISNRPTQQTQGSQGAAGSELQASTSTGIGSMNQEFASKKGEVEQMLVDLVTKCNPKAPAMKGVLQ